MHLNPMKVTRAEGDRVTLKRLGPVFLYPETGTKLVVSLSDFQAAEKQEIGRNDQVTYMSHASKWKDPRVKSGELPVNPAYGQGWDPAWEERERKRASLWRKG